MIIKLKENARADEVEGMTSWLLSQGLEVIDNRPVLGLVGDTGAVDRELIQSLAMVETVERVAESFKRVNRRFHPRDTVIDCSGAAIGGGSFQIIAGPCSVESEEQICDVAGRVRASGAGLLRGGAFKPRTSPYAFQGMRGRGIELLLHAKEKTGMPIVSEIMDISQLELFEQVDVIQVGARNMQNFELLKELGHIDKPILLKRGLSSTISELLMSAEYICSGGNWRVILCERGIRTFETTTRNTLDLAAITVLKELSHLPVVVDPSHALGVSRYVAPMALAAVTAGADGLMIEVHNDPANALCDGPQSLTPDEFDSLAVKIRELLPYAYRYGR